MNPVTDKEITNAVSSFKHEKHQTHTLLLLNIFVMVASKF